VWVDFCEICGVAALADSSPASPTIHSDTNAKNENLMPADMVESYCLIRATRILRRNERKNYGLSPTQHER
jgi:hypothetical protein